MNKEQKQRNEIIHRLLDAEVGQDERQALEEAVALDQSLAREFNALARTMQSLKKGRISAPASFTREVMRKLPERKQNTTARIREFLMKGRVLRWNMAAAMVVVATAFAVILLLRLNGEPLQTAVRSLPDNTVTVTMNLYAPDAHRVTVAGTFNKWKADADALRKGENGYWTISIPLAPGDYSYMFVVDGRAWVTDPNAEAYRDDGFGFKNAVLRVKT